MIFIGMSMHLQRQRETRTIPTVGTELKQIILELTLEEKAMMKGKKHFFTKTVDQILEVQLLRVNWCKLVCRACEKQTQTMKMCSICKSKFGAKVYYCSKSCQETDWAEHKHLHKLESLAVQMMQDSTELMSASYEGNVERVKKLIDEGADVLAVDFQGFSAFQYACIAQKVVVIKLLIELKPEVISLRIHQCGRTYNALHIPCKEGQLEIVKIILEQPSAAELVRPNQVDSRPPIFSACEGGNAQIVRLLLSFGGLEQARFMAGNDFPILVAARLGHLNAVRALVDAYGLGVIDDCDLQGSNCLHMACLFNHVQVAEYLLSLPCGPKLLNHSDINHSTALTHAIVKGHHEVGELLVRLGGKALVIQRLKGQLQDGSEAEGFTAVYTAASCGDERMTHVLLAAVGPEAAVELVGLSNTAGFNPIWMACSSGNARTVMLILSTAGSAADKLLVSTRPGGRSALFIAAAHGHVGVVQLLLVRPCGLELLRQVDDKGCTALFIACEGGFDEVVAALLDAPGGEDLLPLRAMPTLLTCLHVAAREGHVEVVRLLVDCPHGRALLKSRTAQGETPEELARVHGHIELATELMHFDSSADELVD